MANKVQDQVVEEIWKVEVCDGHQIAYADRVYDAGETFEAPVGALEQAVNRGMLERVDG